MLDNPKHPNNPLQHGSAVPLPVKQRQGTEQIKWIGHSHVQKACWQGWRDGLDIKYSWGNMSDIPFP